MSHSKNMHSKISLKKSLIPFGLTGVMFSLIIIFLSPGLIAKSSSVKQLSLTTIQQIKPVKNIVFTDEVISNLPTRLKIPSIKVNSIIEHVGITPKGEMGVPKDQKNVAWFEIGPHPGENGNAVISGHYGWKGGKPSAFDNLYKLRKGDKIYVEDEKGTITTFIVRESRRYKPGDDATNVFVSDDEKSHLNLITCEGVWNKILKSYSRRLVIFADKEEIKK